MSQDQVFENVDEAVAAHDEQETVVEDVFRKEGETQAEYNERVPVGIQPVLPAPSTSYLGKEL